MTKHTDDSNIVQVTNTMMRMEKINRRAGQLLDLNDSNKTCLGFKKTCHRPAYALRIMDRNLCAGNGTLATGKQRLKTTSGVNIRRNVQQNPNVIFIAKKS